MPKKNLISVIIPAYNEEKIIEISIAKVEKVMDGVKRPYEILVVNDGSKDSTGAIIDRMIKSKKHPQLRSIYYADGPSRRENLAKSFKLLKGDYILLLDMDMSMDLKHLKDMVYWLDNGYKMVIPNRYHGSSTIRRNPKRYVISKMYNAFIRFLFHTGLQDNICGFKAFRRDVIMKIVGQTGIDKSSRRSVFWDTEVLVWALRNKVKIKQIPVHWEEGAKSDLNFKREVKMIPYILKFRAKLYRTK